MKILDKISERKKIKIHLASKIKNVVFFVTDINFKQMRLKRDRKTIFAKRLLMFFLYEYGFRICEIIEIVNYKDRLSFYNSMQELVNELELYKEKKQTFNKIKELIKLPI